jgi:hypothetical protein
MTMPIVKDKDYHRALVESLAAAQAEIERLKADKDVQRSQDRNAAYEGDIAELRAENERLLALLEKCSPLIATENERLRAVIQKAIDHGPYWEWQFEARRALDPKP